VASYPDVASFNVNHLDCCNLLWRSIVCSGPGKTSYWSLLRMICLSAFCPVQIFVPAGHGTPPHRTGRCRTSLSGDCRNLCSVQFDCLRDLAADLVIGFRL
jgi:hypothetical protein